MSFELHITHVSSVAEAIANSHTFQVTAGYSGVSFGGQTLTLLRYISEPFSTVGYIDPAVQQPPSSSFVTVTSTVVTSDGSCVMSDGLSGVPTDILDNVFGTIDAQNRYVAYVIQSTPNDTTACPYALFTHTTWGMALRSTKTQVRHDILYSEGELVWKTDMRRIPPTAPNMSRVAVDVMAISRDSAHHGGPEGLGGWGWVGERGTGCVYRLSLRTGDVYAIYVDSDFGGGARGLAIDGRTGNLYASGDDASKLIELTVDPLDPHTGTQTRVATLSAPAVSGVTYGMVPVARQPSVFYCVVRGSSVVRWDAGAHEGHKVATVASPYGICSGPDGSVWVTTDDGKLLGVDGPATGLSMQLPGGTGGGFFAGVTCEFSHLYPNNGTGYSIFVAHNESSTSGTTIRAYFEPTTKTLSGPWTTCMDGDMRGVSIDSENNVWGTQNTGAYFYVTYRMQNNSAFPFGGLARYPAVAIADHVLVDQTNTREIEWFLTRDPDQMSLDARAAWLAIVGSNASVSYDKSVTYPGIGIRQYDTWTSGTKMTGAALADRIFDALLWYNTYANPTFHPSALINRVGKFLHPGYLVAGGLDKCKQFPKDPSDVAGSIRSTYLYADFTGNTVHQAGVIYSDVETSDIPTDYEHSSSHSSMGLSESSSSSLLADLVGIDAIRTTYLSECENKEAINNPKFGRDAGMCASGYFDEVLVPYASAFEGDNKHIVRGGLSKTLANRGALYCYDASKLFSMSRGYVGMRLSLPHAVANGVYEPLLGATDLLLKDYVLWGVNFGDHYVTLPGLYAAMTPYGIEFTVWSSAGKFSVLDTTSDLAANVDALYEFAWDSDSGLLPTAASMLIAVNGNVTSWGMGVFANDPLRDGYDVVGASTTTKHCEFWALDTPKKTNGLLCALRRIETASAAPERLRDPVGYSSSSSSSSLGCEKIIWTAVAEMGFDFTGRSGHEVALSGVDFMTVARKRANLLASGPIVSAFNRLGADAGGEAETDVASRRPKDLPPGFEETRGVQS